MNFGMDYVGALMSRIGGAGSVWSGYGTGSVRKSGRQQLTKGQAVAQASYADTFMKMSKAERREAVESGTRKNTDELYNSAKNLVDGYNDIVSQAKNSTATIIGTRATAMKNDAAGNKDALSEIGISYNSKNGTLSIDEKKFKAADKDKVKNLLGREGSFGQRIRSNSTLIQSVAATAVRNSTTSAYGSNGLYGTNSLYGLMSSYGLGSSYGLTGNYGLSSFLGNWLA